MMSNDRDFRMLQMEEDQTLQVQKKTKKMLLMLEIVELTMIYKQIKALIIILVQR